VQRIPFSAAWIDGIVAGIIGLAIGLATGEI
jgi:hypothetical protein